MAINVNDICPRCGQANLIQVSNELRCEKCGYAIEIFDTEDSLWLKEYNSSVKWDNSLFDDLPAVIGHEYSRLKWMLERGKVYATIMQMKDVYEVTMKFAVLCAAAEVRQPTLTAQLVRGNLSVGTWEQILRTLCTVKNRSYVYEGVSESLRAVMSSFKSLIDSASVFGSGRHFSTWRNEFLGHGALGFSAGEKYRSSLPLMAEGLAKHFAECRACYKEIVILLDGQPMSYKAVQNHRTIGEGAMAVSVGGKVIEIDPFMLRKNDGIYFFDDYKSRGDNAFALNYINANKCGYHAPYLGDIYDRMKHEISADAAASDLTADFTKEQLEHEFNRLNAAYHFVKPQYITDWLTGCLYDQIGGKINQNCLGKGVLHLMMERGMGKTSYAYALDTQYGGDDHIDLSDTVVRVFYCSRIQLRSVQEFADGIRNELKRGAEAHNGKDFPVLVYEKNAASTTNARHMAKFLSEFRHIHADELQNGRRLLLVLDGLDEIPQDCAEIFDFIPDGNMLAEDCYLLLTSRNPQTEQLAPAVAQRIGQVQPDSRLSVVRGSEENRAVLRQYISNMTKNVDKEFRIDVDSAQADQLIALADDTFLNLTMYLQLVKSGLATDRLAKMPNAELLQFYMDRLHDIYGDKLFDDSLKVLAVVLTAQEPLTVQEIAALSGRGDPDLMLLAYMKDLAPFMKNIHAGGRTRPKP